MWRESVRGSIRIMAKGECKRKYMKKNKRKEKKNRERERVQQGV